MPNCSYNDESNSDMITFEKNENISPNKILKKSNTMTNEKKKPKNNSPPKNHMQLPNLPSAYLRQENSVF